MDSDRVLSFQVGLEDTPRVLECASHTSTNACTDSISNTMGGEGGGNGVTE